MDEELSKAIEDGTVGPKADPKDGRFGWSDGNDGMGYESETTKTWFLQVVWFQWEKLQDEYISWYDFRSWSFVSFRFSILEWWEVLIHPNVRQFVA